MEPAFSYQTHLELLTLNFPVWSIIFWYCAHFYWWKILKKGPSISFPIMNYSTVILGAQAAWWVKLITPLKFPRTSLSLSLSPMPMWGQMKTLLGKVNVPDYAIQTLCASWAPSEHTGVHPVLESPPSRPPAWALRYIDSLGHQHPLFVLLRCTEQCRKDRCLNYALSAFQQVEPVKWQ